MSWWFRFGTALVLSILLIAAPISPLFERQTAHAIPVQETGTNLIKNTITSVNSILIAASTYALEVKEYILDPIVWLLKNVVIRYITWSIVQWINSGFQGAPAFVTDPLAFLIDIADYTAGEFIYGSQLDFLCSPFEIQVRGALAFQYYYGNLGLNCRLTDVLDNVENAAFGLVGSINNWPSWLAMTTQAANNPYGSFHMTQSLLQISIRTAQETEVLQWNWGNGFLSTREGGFLTWKECDVAGPGAQECEIMTPGKVVSRQLNDALGLGQEELIIADEFDEIIAALLAQLVVQTLTGLRGLRGLSSGNYEGGGSYIDQVGAGNDDYVGDTNYTNPLFAQGLENETNARTIYQDIFMRIESAEQVLGRPEPLDDCDYELSPQLLELRDSASQGVADTTARIMALQNIVDTVDSDPDQLPERYEEYLAIKDGLHTIADLDSLQDWQDTAQDDIDDWEEDAEDYCEAQLEDYYGNSED